MGRISEPISLYNENGGFGQITTKMVALGSYNENGGFGHVQRKWWLWADFVEDISIEASLGDYTVPVVEKPSLKNKQPPRACDNKCVILRVIRYTLPNTPLTCSPCR